MIKFCIITCAGTNLLVDWYESLTQKMIKFLICVYSPTKLNTPRQNKKDVWTFFLAYRIYLDFIFLKKCKAIIQSTLYCGYI